MVGAALGPGACDHARGGAVALPADPAAGRPVRPHGPLPGRARPRPLAVAVSAITIITGRAIGNLGVDLLVMPLGRLIGLEPAVKLIVLAIPPLTVAGFLWVAREVHGRMPPTAFFALPFVYGYPFLFGFVNFALSMALAFLAFGLWLRLGRLERTQAARDAVRADLARRLLRPHLRLGAARPAVLFGRSGAPARPRPRAGCAPGIEAALHASVMALPILIMLVWRSETHGGTTCGWFDWKLKWRLDLFGAARPLEAVRHRARWSSPALVFVYALVSRKLTLSRNLAFSAIVLAVCLRAAAADRVRLGLCRHAAGALSDRGRAARDPLPRRRRPRDWRRCSRCSACCSSSIRIGGNDRQPGDRRRRPAGEARRRSTMCRRGARRDHARSACRAANIGRCCATAISARWSIVRREGFSNDQWLIEGVNLLDLKYRAAGYFAADPSQLVRPQRLPRSAAPDDRQALAALPRDDFDYVWLIDVPPYDPRLVAGHAAGLARTGLHPLSVCTHDRAVDRRPLLQRGSLPRRAARAADAPRRAPRSATIMRSCWSTTARATAAGR